MKTYKQIARMIEKKMELYEQHLKYIQNNPEYDYSYKSTIIDRYNQLCDCVDTLNNAEEF